MPATTFFAAAFAGAAAFFVGAAAFFTGAAFLATGAFLPTAAFFGAAFFATTFFTAAFFAGLALPLCAFAAVFAAAGLAFDFAAVAGLATGFFADGFGFAAGRATVRPAFAGVLLAFFTTFPFAVAVFDAVVLTAFALIEALSFSAFLLELPVVFAISLHRGWPWRPGVIAHVSFTSKSGSGILLHYIPGHHFGSMNPLTRLILWLLRLYKRWISPLFGSRCRFYPSCSDYARIAVVRFGPWRGSLLTGWRLLRCQPLCHGGQDPVPEHFHFSRCHDRGDSAQDH